MITFAVDNNNNLLFKSDIIVKSGLDAIVQDVRTRLNMWKGEDIYNIENGIDYKNIIQSNNIQVIKNIIKDEILKDDRIEKIEFLEFNNYFNKLNIKLQIETTEGVAIV